MGKAKTEEQIKAYDLFCNTMLMQKEIASVVNVSAQQMSKWVKDGNWEMYRTAHQTSLPSLIQSFYLQLAEINKSIRKDFNGIPQNDHTDSISKITSAIEKLNKKHNLSAYHQVLRECLEWMLKWNAEKAKIFGPAMLEFLKEKAKSLNNDTSIG